MASPRFETASSIRFAFVDTSDPLLGETTFLLRAVKQIASRLSERPRRKVFFYLSEVDAGAAVEGGFSSALPSSAVCCLGISGLESKVAEVAVVQGAEAAGKAGVAAGKAGAAGGGAVLGWTVPNTRQ